MATQEQLEQALRASMQKARSGDARAAELARRFATELQALRQPAQERSPEEVEAELQRLVPGVSTNPADGMSTPFKMAAGAGASLQQAKRGIQQLTGNLSQEEVDAAAQVEAPLLATKAGLGGNVMGHIAQLLVPAGAALKLGSNAPRLAMAGRVVLNPRAAVTATGAKGAAQGMGVAGAIGAGQAGLQPVVSGESRLGNAAQGAAYGAAGQGVGEALGAMIRPLIRAAGAGRQANATAGDVIRAETANPATIAALQSGQVAGDIIPGSARTTAEVTRDKGLAALERSLRSKPGISATFSDIDEARNVARVGLIRTQFNGASSDAAQGLRETVQAAEGPVINAAKKVVGAETGRVIAGIDRVARSARFAGAPKVQETLTKVRGLLAVPLDDAARIKAAREMATDAITSTAGKRMSSADFYSIREAARLIRGAAQRGESADEVLKQVAQIKPTSVKAVTHLANMKRALKTVERGKPDVASLYNTRKYITQTLMKNADSEQMFALRGVIGRLDDEIVAVAPSYKQYLKNYTAGMRLADQAEVGARILKTGQPRASDPVAGVQLGAMTARAADNLETIVRGATGFPRAKVANTLTGPQQGAVRSVAQDIDSQGWVQSQSRALKGQSITGELGESNDRLASLATGVAANSIPGGNLGLMAADAILSQVGKRQGARVQGLVAEAMANPARAREILQSLPVSVRQDVIRTLGAAGETRVLAAAGYAGASVATDREPMDIGTVYGLDRNDRRYRGD